MRFLIIFYISLLVASHSFGRTIYSKCDGYWDDPNTWKGYIIPEVGDSIYVINDIRISSDILLINNYLNITINSQICGNFNVVVSSGSLVIVNGTLRCSIFKNLPNSNTIISSTGFLDINQLISQGPLFVYGTLMTTWNGVCAPIVNPCADFTVSDAIICEGSCINFSDISTNNPTSWNWQFNGASSLTSSAQNPQNICFYYPGIYYVKLTVNNDYGSNNIVKQQLIHVLSRSSSTIHRTACNYYFSPSGKFVWTSSGNYMDTIQNVNNCDSVITIDLIIEYCGCLFVPNSFSPNGDGVNDYFYPIVTCPCLAYHLKIFTQWGEEIFCSNNPDDKWDGRFNENIISFGVYIYKINYQFEGMQTAESKLGSVTLIR